MIALWMLYAIIVTAMLGLGAALLERAGGPYGLPRRWLWLCALALAVVLPAAEAFGPEPSATSASDRAIASLQGDRAPATAPSALVAERLADLIARADGAGLAARLNTPLAWLWGLAALLAVSAYGAAAWLLARTRRSWRATEVDGHPVLLAPSAGPAVVGALRPQIVVPEWALALPREQRALMLAHEREHVRARDPLLLHAAALVALIMPWNVAAWWLNRRLRLAVELDCDARVLAGGRDAREYGTLLLDVCARRTRRGAVLAPALLERGTSLTKRILAMHPPRPRFLPARTTLGAGAALVLVALACEMPTPEMLAPDGKDAPAARVYGTGGGAKQVTPAELRASIAKYFPAVARGEGGASILFIVASPEAGVVLTERQPANGFVRVPRTESPDPVVPLRAARALREEAVVRGELRARRSATDAPPLRLKSMSRALPLPSGVGALRPDDIASIEISKHAAGTVAPEPVSFIIITLKPGAKVPPRPGTF